MKKIKITLTFFVGFIIIASIVGCGSDYEEETTITDITLSNDEIDLTMVANEKIQIGTQIKLSGYSATDIVWTSSNSSVATVDDNGVVTACGVGVAKRSARLKGRQYLSVCTINVGYIKSESLILTKDNVTISVGHSDLIQGSIMPENAYYKTISWTSENTDVATVDKNGLIEAKMPGETNVIAQTHDGIKSVCHVIVKSNSAIDYNGWGDAINW